MGIKSIKLDEIVEATRTPVLTPEEIEVAVQTLQSGEAVSTSETFTTQGRALWAAERMREAIESAGTEYEDGLHPSILTWTEDAKTTYRFAIVLRPTHWAGANGKEDAA